MKMDEYVKKVKFAWEVAQKAPEEIKTDVFQITYSSLLTQNVFEQTNPKLELMNSNENLVNSTFDQKMKIFAEKCNLSISDIKDIFYIDDMEIHMLVKIDGADAEKQTIAAQCILTAYQLLFDKEWVDARQLNKCVTDSNIGGMDHFARNLRRRKNILIRGKGKGTTLEYKISGVGKLEAFEVIHDLIKGGT
jgi:hypothetical protein